MVYEKNGDIWVPSECSALKKPGRRLFIGAAGAVVASTAIGEEEAEANPLLWVGGVALSWAIGKVLDSVWDKAADSFKKKYAKPKPDPTPTPIGRRRYDGGHSCDCRFGKAKTWSSPSDDKKIYFFPAEFIQSFEVRKIDAHYMYSRWGAPTGGAFARRLDDGILGGQWFSQLKDRYVVFRTFDNGRKPVYLPCLSTAGSGYHRKAQRVVEHGELHKAGPRLRNLITNPVKYKFLEEDRPENA